MNGATKQPEAAQLPVPVETPARTALAVQDVREQISLIQDLMKSVMHDGEHYGKIPGCGDKPTLLKSGAEKLSMTFRLLPRYEVSERDMGKGHREFSVRCILLYGGRDFAGEGVGSCSTMESKFRFRWDATDKDVPKEYWDSRDPALLGGTQFCARKQAGKWKIFQRAEHDNPADYYNTCLKMAKKRAHVDAVLTATAASDIFTQDVEDLAENGKASVGKDEPPEATPKEMRARADALADEAERLTAKSKREREAGQPTSPSAQSDDSPPTAGDEGQPGPDEWREVEIHFGKNAGKKLGELTLDSLVWYQDTWQPKEYKGRIDPRDIALRRALDDSKGIRDGKF